MHDNPGTLVLWRKWSLPNSDGITLNGGTIAFVHQSSSIWLTRRTTRNMSIRHGGLRPQRCAGGEICGVINNVGCRGNLFITRMAHLALHVTRACSLCNSWAAYCKDACTQLCRYSRIMSRLWQLLKVLLKLTRDLFELFVHISWFQPTQSVARVSAIADRASL